MIAQLQQAQRLLQLDWARLPAESPLAGCTIGETRIRSLTGASIVAVLRNGQLTPNPEPVFRLESDDMLGLLASPTQRAQLEAMM